MIKEIMVVSGKRKSAVAKVKIVAGHGEVTYNGLPYQHLPRFAMLSLREPLMIAEEVLGKIPANMSVKTSSGGKEGQIQAARLGIAKALVKFTQSADLKKAYIKYDRNLLVADIRRKETYKPGDSKARAKRQKSYR
jgi:small subunit ribosomal protein S9